ncbi:MAG: 16S rRNA (adenine(1518)-N(6)/adenine(1519)-N(6))-dimethyltransferase RsmA [Clostridia bacterium]|nr:16S rRNA (adenine(1518)-N(6)/adenine(1519)-N(6))-dimethyltransferase RsmA [Clostridia bacterium]
MDLNNIKTIREILERHGFHFSKALGQNFLTAAWVPREIVARSEIDETVGVLEIGPGMGCLTRELSKEASKVVAVEIDKALMPVLEETVGDVENIEVINEDILKVNLEELMEKFCGLKKYVCANLPYYITTPILSHLLESRLFESITVMMQKEVAHRLCAAPATSDYGAFTVFVQYYSEPEILFDVPKGCFVPQPKVDSAVVRLHVRKAPPVEVSDEKLFFRVVRASFAQRRKQLTNGLTSAFGSDFTKAELAEILTEVGISPGVRGETLSISQFADIANMLYKRLLDKKI